MSFQNYKGFYGSRPVWHSVQSGRAHKGMFMDLVLQIYAYLFNFTRESKLTNFRCTWLKYKGKHTQIALTDRP